MFANPSANFAQSLENVTFNRGMTSPVSQCDMMQSIYHLRSFWLREADSSLSHSCACDSQRAVTIAVCKPETDLASARSEASARRRIGRANTILLEAATQTFCYLKITKKPLELDKAATSA